MSDEEIRLESIKLAIQFQCSLHGVFVQRNNLQKNLKYIERYIRTGETTTDEIVLMDREQFNHIGDEEFK